MDEAILALKRREACSAGVELQSHPLPSGEEQRLLHPAHSESYEEIHKTSETNKQRRFPSKTQVIGRQEKAHVFKRTLTSEKQAQRRKLEIAMGNSGQYSPKTQKEKEKTVSGISSNRSHTPARGPNQYQVCTHASSSHTQSQSSTQDATSRRLGNLGFPRKRGCGLVHPAKPALPTQTDEPLENPTFEMQRLDYQD